MKEQFQQAIAAARAGQTKDAQLLLTQILQEDGEDVQSWFLLSQLVDSEQKKIAYLQKTVALDPTHPKAKAQLEQYIVLDKSESEPMMNGDAADSQTAVTPSVETETIMASSGKEPATSDLFIAPEPVPLEEDKQELAEIAPDTETITEKTAAVTETAPATTTQKDDKAKELAKLNRTLALLGIGAIIVLIILFLSLGNTF